MAVNVHGTVTAGSDEDTEIPCRVKYEFPHELPRRTDFVHWLYFQAPVKVGYARDYAEGVR